MAHNSHQNSITTLSSPLQPHRGYPPPPPPPPKKKPGKWRLIVNLSASVDRSINDGITRHYVPYHTCQSMSSTCTGSGHLDGNNGHKRGIQVGLSPSKGQAPSRDAIVRHILR